MPSRQSARDTRLLQALIAVTGLHLGAGLYEARVVIPRWARAPTPREVGAALEHSGHIASGRAFWPWTGLPILLLTAANLPAGLRCRDHRRKAWLALTGMLSLGSAATVTYFVPTLGRLRRAQDLPEPTVRALVSRWVWADRLRLLAGTTTWLAALTALTPPEAGEPTRATSKSATGRPS